jgi:hypothetical protein
MTVVSFDTRSVLDGNICGSYENGASVQCNAGMYVICLPCGDTSGAGFAYFRETPNTAFPPQSLVATGELFTFPVNVVYAVVHFS